MFHTEQQHLQAPSGNFPLAINPKELANYGGRASWRDCAFNMEGDPVLFIDDQIALKATPDVRLCLRAGDDRRVWWSGGLNDPSTHYLTFQKFPYGKS
ncbi:hypothetical protein CKO45_08285 [Paracraurococcus ruber]|uniref:Uncharacterized protein n=2 Tax=Paracraurococcus ruber TaxID=77675 RepID=A0ABS1CUN5_9PROT|nr:hypothetical protein [Paracraurococcus ruber]